MGEDTENGFVELVKDCYEKKRSRIIHNASIEHAKVLFQYLFTAATDGRKEVEIVSANLNKEFYGALVTDAQGALDKGCKVSLIVLDPETDISDNLFANTVNNHTMGKVWKSQELLKAPHFILVGDNQFRLETDHAQTKAMASFNNKEVGSFLKECFGELQNTIAKQIPCQ